MNTETQERRPMTTADLAMQADRRTQREAGRPERVSDVDSRSDEALVALFKPDVAADFQSRWDAVQGSFVDDPRQAVRRGDELVAQVMQTLAQTFASERERLEGELDQIDTASTEDLRLALRRYRSFFQRLLTM